MGTDAARLALAGRGQRPVRCGARLRCGTRYYPDSTLLGLHVLNGTRDREVLSFVRRLAESGHPVASIKGMNSAENLLNEIEKISPQTVTVYRSMLSSDGFGDCPVDVRDAPDPVATAQRWMDGLEDYWSLVNADYYEVINECPVGLEWINAFMIEVMKIANERGRCLLLFSFPGGTSRNAGI